MAMQHVKQTNEIDCGLAVAAMVCGVTWDDAADWDPDPDAETGLTVTALEEMVVDITDELGFAEPLRAALERPASWQMVREGAEGDPAAVLIHRKNDPSDAHWVAYWNGLVFDPADDKPVPVAQYKHAHWPMLYVLVVKRDCMNRKRG